MALPAQKNITIYQGDTYELIFRLKDTNGDYVNLTGCTAKSQIRATASTGTVAAEFTATILTQSGATLGGVSLTLSAATTGALSLTTPGVWDVQLTWPDNTVRTYLAGTVTLTREVTRV